MTKGAKQANIGTIINIIGRTLETLDLKIGWTGSGVWLQKRHSKTVLLQMSDAEMSVKSRKTFCHTFPWTNRSDF
jgi:hypothetical protein